MVGATHTSCVTLGAVPAHLLAYLPADETEVEKKMQEYGISFSYVKSLPRVVAIFAPFLAGPLGELIKTILP